MTGSKSPILLFGATGMLGQALLRAGRLNGLTIIGVARHNADETCDITDPAAVERLAQRVQPAAIINAAALTDLAACEANPTLANAINAQAVGTLAAICGRDGLRLIHISTDHFFCGDGDALHDEHAPVQLVNEYARSKLAGEAFALACSGALVIRTNVTGFRGWREKPTFAEWAFEAVERDTEMILFDDFITSTIDAGSLAKAVFKLCLAGKTGLLNVAAGEAASKRQLVETLAACLGKSLTRCRTGSVLSLQPRRAESLGLDVGAAEATLGYRLPALADVVSSLVREYRERCATIPPSR